MAESLRRQVSLTDVSYLRIARRKRFCWGSAYLEGSFSSNKCIYFVIMWTEQNLCFSFLFRESPAELIGVLDVPTLYSNPAPGTGTGSSERVCRNLTFYSSF